MNFLKECYKQPFKYLQQRKLLYYVSNPQLISDQSLESVFPQKSSVYIGFDPTAESIHLGNLIGLIALNHFRISGQIRFIYSFITGYNPIIVFGGATGLIGDPSGRSSERKQQSVLQVEHNVSKITEQFKYLLSNMNTKIEKDHQIENQNMNDYIFVNNYDFYKDMNVLSFMRDVGIHFRMGTMLSRESVKSRMEGGADEGGMSFTEFCYQTLQGYDYLKLRQLYNCRLQIGGSDQWGNIASGCELIRKVTGEESFGATYPLLVNSKGQKFGKSEGNTGILWLDPTKTSPYDLYQFFLNVSDQEVEDLLLKLTFLPVEEITSKLEEHAKNTEMRIGQKFLAQYITEMIHGKQSIQSVIESTDAFFGLKINKEELLKMGIHEFEQHFQHTEKVRIKKSELKEISGLIVKSGLRNSRAEVKRLITQKGIQINGEIVDVDKTISESDLLFGKFVIVKIGKKHYSLVEIIE